MSNMKFNSLFCGNTLASINEESPLDGFDPNQSIQQQLTLNLNKKKDLKLNPDATSFVPSVGDNHGRKEKKISNSKMYKKMDKFIPVHKPRAKLNIYIGKPETRKLKKELKEEFQNTSTLYHYLDVTTAFQMSDNQMYIYHTVKQPRISFINFDLHNKDTDDVLYGVVLPNEIEKIQKCNANISGKKIKWLWKLDSFLTAGEIYNTYDIPLDDLPKSSRKMHKLNDNMMKRQNINPNILNEINWSNNNSNIQKFASKSKRKTKKITVELNEKVWVDKCVKSWDDFVAIPILVYENSDINGFKYFIEWVKLVYIEEYESYIGLSFQKSNDKFVFGSIHLNKTDVINKHRLFGCISCDYTKCFDKFNESIADIQWFK